MTTTTTTAKTTPFRHRALARRGPFLREPALVVRLSRTRGAFRAASTHARGEDGDHFQRARARFARGPSSARGPAGPAAAVHHAPGVRERAAAVPGAAELRRAEVLRPGTRAPARGPAEEPPASLETLACHANASQPGAFFGRGIGVPRRSTVVRETRGRFFSSTRPPSNAPTRLFRLFRPFDEKKTYVCFPLTALLTYITVSYTHV